jgi:HEAT repeats
MSKKPRLAALILTFTGLTTLAGSQEPGRVPELLRQLGSTRFAERQAAAEALDKIGEPALAALRKMADTAPDLEVRRRAEQVIDRIETRLYGAFRVTRADEKTFQRLAEIFSPPGTPSIVGKSLVTVETGPENFPFREDGWLIEDTPREITLLPWAGDLQKIRKPRPGEKRPSIAKDKDGSFSFVAVQEADHSEVWKVRPEDFAARRKKFLDDGLPGEKDKTNLWAGVDQRFSLQGHVIEASRFAHYAYQRGEKLLAMKLYDQARKARQKYIDHYEPQKSEEYHLFVGRSLASGLRNSAIYAGHGTIARRELQKRWEKIATIPYHPYRDEAREMARHYQKLVDEDSRWVEPDPGALAKMTPEQKVRYWMYHLRDLAMGQCSDPGRCSVFFDGTIYLEGKKRPLNAAIELTQLGMAAVPQLIAHLDDPRPTRCKGHWRSYWPDGHYLLRYGDCCQQIFEHITGKTITKEGYPMQAGKGKEARAAAEHWWQDYQTKGERQMLIEATAAGDQDSPRQAQRLAEKYPDAALAPIVQGARACTEGRVRASLIQIAEELKDTNVLPFLHAELEGRYHDSRVAAARALAMRGEPAGLKSLLREWNKLLTSKSDNPWAMGEMLEILTHSGDPGTLRQVGGDLVRLDFNERCTFVTQLASLEKDLRNRPLTRQAADAIEDLLVKAMGDREQPAWYTIRGNGKQVIDPPIGDIAAQALAARWKQPALFDITAPLQDRERQRLVLKNQWREKRGQKSIPLPPPRQVEPLHEAKLQPLIKAAQDAKTSTERAQAVRAIEALGLPALPAVRKLQKSLPANHPAISDMRSLAKRLALIVRETRFAEDSAPPSPALRRKVAAQQGKPVTEEAYMDLLHGTASALPEGTRGIRISLERLPDDTGVYLVVTLIADRPAREGLSPQLQYGNDVQIGDKMLEGGGGGMVAGIGRNVGLAELDWSGFRKNLRAALTARPEQYLLVQSHCAEVR